MTLTPGDLDLIADAVNADRNMCEYKLAVIMTDDRDTQWWLDAILALVSAGTLSMGGNSDHLTFSSMEPCITCAWPPFGRAESHVEFMTRHGFKGRHYYSPHIPE